MDERRFHALGTVVHVIADQPRHVRTARALLEQLEARWSRFVATSDVSRCNRLAGSPCAVHPDTLDLVARSVDAWRATGGLFDPTIHDALVDAGYDRTFEAVAARDTSPIPPPPPEIATDRSGIRTKTSQFRVGGAACGAIRVDRPASTITLPAGTRIDLGGIGKGRAADLIAEALVADGCEHLLVNLGGDLRAVGGHPDGGPWRIAIEQPTDATARATELRLDDGALATSSRTKRRWAHRGQVRHHLIDPRTGEPATSSLLAVTVLAQHAVDADVWAKVALIADETAALELLGRHRLPALLARADGGWSCTPELTAHLDPSTPIVDEAAGAADSLLTLGPDRLAGHVPSPA